MNRNIEASKGQMIITMPSHHLVEFDIAKQVFQLHMVAMRTGGIFNTRFNCVRALARFVNKLACLITTFAIGSACTFAHAQTRPVAADSSWPNRPITFVVPAAAGGAGDIFARTIGQKLSDALGQPVVIDNRPGAGMTIGTSLAAKAKPDGYTIMLAHNSSFVLNFHLFSKLPYDPIKDFDPVTQGTYYGYALVVNPSFPAKSVKELVELSRSAPISYASSGIGTPNHLAAELFAHASGAKLVHVPYKGNAAAMADVLSGHVPVMFDTVITSLPQITAGKLRALAYSGKRRAVQLPDLPTINELGYLNFEIGAWQGVAVPAGTPKSIIDRLYLEVAKALKMPDVIDRLGTKGGNELIGNTPTEFAELIRSEIIQYGKMIKGAGIKPE